MSITGKLFWKEIKRLGIKTDSKLLLAMSGGLDSVVLFHLLVAAKLPFVVAHVNYGLRDADSDGDETFCRDLCKKNGITCHVYDAKTDMRQRGTGESIQEKAREIRYAFFKRLLENENGAYILTAHHANDSVETFFVNLVRGTGIQGLGGIPEKNGNIVRPLLNFTKEALQEYAQSNQLSYREDVSNAKDDYLRNRIRHHVIPAMEKAEKDAVTRLKDNMGRIGNESALLTFFMGKTLGYELDKTAKESIRYFPKPLWTTVIFKHFQSIGINYSQAEDMALALDDIAGKQFLLPKHRLLLDRDFIYAKEIQSKEEKTYTISSQKDSIPGYTISVIEKDGFKISTDKSEAYLDFDKLQFPMVWRKVEKGDSMIPLGMKGRKKVSDILIDAKVNRFEKERLHVLCSGQEIIWLEGFRINDSSKITDSTCRILCIIPEKL